MWKKKNFSAKADALAYIKRKEILSQNIVYIAEKDGHTELVYRTK